MTKRKSNDLHIRLDPNLRASLESVASRCDWPLSFVARQALAYGLRFLDQHPMFNRPPGDSPPSRVKDIGDTNRAV